MKKPLHQEVFDQTIHFTVAALVTLVVHPTHWWGGLVLGLSLGVVREVTEGGNVLSSGSVRDMIFWTLGGLFMGMAYAA